MRLRRGKTHPGPYQRLNALVRKRREHVHVQRRCCREVAEPIKSRRSTRNGTYGFIEVVPRRVEAYVLAGEGGARVERAEIGGNLIGILLSRRRKLRVELLRGDSGSLDQRAFLRHSAGGRECY